MAEITYTLSLTKDHTIEIKVGRYKEQIDLLHKEKSEIFDAVKYALISKDAFISDAHLTQDLYDMIWRYV